MTRIPAVRRVRALCFASAGVAPLVVVAAMAPAAAVPMTAAGRAALVGFALSAAGLLAGFGCLAGPARDRRRGTVLLVASTVVLLGVTRILREQLSA